MPISCHSTAILLTFYLRNPNPEYFILVQGGLFLLNPLKPLSSRGNKDHRVISRSFGVVQLCKTCSNHSTTQQNRPIPYPLFRETVNGQRYLYEPPRTHEKYPMILVSSRVQWFKQVRKSWTTSCQAPLQAQAGVCSRNTGRNVHASVRDEVQLVPLISCWTTHAAVVKGKIHLKLVCLDTTRQALDG